MEQEIKKIKNVEEEKKTPMMIQYEDIKKQYEDCILLYRLGDFYEMFNEDAHVASKILGLTLTSRNSGNGNKTAMCGIPFHSSDSYISRLVSAGKKVAICEQLSDPNDPNNKLVIRDVVKVITAGTITDTSTLDDKVNNFVCSVFMSNQQGGFGVCWVDITTGELTVKEIAGDNAWTNLNDTLMYIKPSEVICNFQPKQFAEKLTICQLGYAPEFQMFYDWAFTKDKAEKIIKNQFNIMSLDKSDIATLPMSICACGAMLEYIQQTQKKTLQNIYKIQIKKDQNYMYIDSIARRNLELVESMKDRKTKYSLLWVLDKTQTSMGGRTLRKMIEQPLFDMGKINARLDAVEELKNNSLLRHQIKEVLAEIGDLERMVGKVANGSINPKDLVAVKCSLEQIPTLKSLMSRCTSKLLTTLYNSIGNFEVIVNTLMHAIDCDNVLNLPSHIRDGGFIRKGFNDELDNYRDMKSNVASKIAQLELDEREATQIKTLKVGYNSVFGYYIEIPKSQINSIPLGRYERKQTLTNTERYTLPALKEMENDILNSEQNAITLEQKIFVEIISMIKEKMDDILVSARAIGYFDSIYSLAEVATENNFCKPQISDDNEIVIKNGRHPVVECIKKSNSFIPNDTELNNADEKIMVITGPNMAGKSTYLRQVAIITLMAHIGSFVSATSAKICLTDRIFTRIGASDDLAQGQSTFMMEMLEVSNILCYATSKSLIILDEVGRGTSTHDGLSLAWALIEYLSRNNVGKVLFSTHYHELTELEGELNGVKNYQIAVRENQGEIIFLRKIMRGGAQRSFGIEVGAMAGLPNEIIQRAKSILLQLENNNLHKNIEFNVKTNDENSQENYSSIIQKLSSINIDAISPLEAFSILHDCISEIKESKNEQN